MPATLPIIPPVFFVVVAFLTTTVVPLLFSDELLAALVRELAAVDVDVATAVRFPRTDPEAVALPGTLLMGRCEADLVPGTRAGM
jgi:hypothetical protein